MLLGMIKFRKKIPGLLLIVVFVFLTGKAYSKKTTIYGNAPDYAGKELTFFVYEDFISEKKKEIFELKFDKNGDFRKEFNLACQRPVFSLAGIYKLWFVATPGEEYKIVFPPFEKKTKAEEYNPYFNPLVLMAGVVSEDKKGVNSLINKFEKDYDEVLNRKMLDFMVEGGKKEVKKYIDSLKTDYPQETPEFFAVWKKYRFAQLRRFSYEKNHRYVINKYFRKDSVYYQNPAYIELFKDVFTDYYGHFLMRPDGDDLLEAVNIYKSPKKISEVLSRMFELDNRRLREFVMIKGLKDAYYRDNYKKKSIRICLDSISMISEHPVHRKIADNVLAKIAKLRKGSDAPELNIVNLEGDTIDENTLKNQYTYVAFLHSELVPSKRQMGPLNDIASGFNKNLRVWVILMDDDKKRAIKNMEKYNNKNWRVGFPVNKEKIKERYEIVTFPFYYLIGPDKKLVFSPAPSPVENFKRYFKRYVKY